MDCTENTASSSSSIVGCMSVAAIMWQLLSHWLEADIFVEPFPSNSSCLYWLHNSCFQQTCYNIIYTYVIEV
jgi:hypothetical protein